ncbi:MAG: hypothetical protein L0170_19770, partial [Acidobacteria bacterium]|nr:hypothetical protein [Acidobacteriota bacterium]
MNGQSGRSGRLAEILTLLVLVVSVASAASAQQTTAPPPQITGDYRLMLQQDFVADAALVRSTWLELRGDYA